MGKDHTVLDNSTWFDLAATPDYTIFNSTFDEATIGNNRIFNVCSVKILCRAGVSGSGVDGPVIAEQSFCCFDVDERDVCIIITLEVCKRCKITSVCNTSDIQILGRCIDDLWKSIHGRNFSCLTNKFNEELFLHNIGIHENIALLSTSTIQLNRFNTFLFVQVQDITVQERFSCVID